MRLIDADALIAFMRKGWRVFPSSKLQHTCDITDIENAPTVDAEPVRHGHWVKKWNTFFKQDVWHCDVCEKGSPLKYDYCPSCGAKMDEVREDVSN